MHSRKLTQMGKASRNPRYNVISIRVSEEERRHLNTLVERNCKNVSDFMRQALVCYATRDDRA
jgi:predicted transcriptional regulator